MASNTSATAHPSCPLGREAHLLPWVEQPRSAFALIFFVCAMVGAAMIKYIVISIIDRSSLFAMSFKRPTFFIRINSLFRYVVYRKPKFLFGCPPGAAILILAFAIFSMAWVLSVHPYYNEVVWQCGSPLLSVRAGWFSLSTTPIIFALGMKRNAITVLTGISYEKLNVYHRWLARICLVTALIHGIPFFVRAYQRETLVAEWNASVAWWSGIVAWFVLLWIIISSLVPLRKMGYEFFVAQHIISAIAYLALVYVHTRDLFTSWIYLWATIAIYGSAIVIRAAASAWWTIKTEKATISMLPDTAVSVRIKAPARKGQWTAGQHAFLRFLALRPYQTHPFTIASVEEDGELCFIIKQREGITKALYQKVKRRKTPWTTRVIIDGPYGGPGRDPGAFDTVILAAGGVGVTFTLPVIKDLVRRMQTQAKVRCSKIIFVWTVRTENTLDWILPEIESCVEAEKCLQVELYVTGASEKSDFSEIIRPQLSVEGCRPNLRKIIMEEAEHEGKMCIMGAGPEGMMATLRDTVGEIQLKVIKGGGSGEIFLYVEPFGW